MGSRPRFRLVLRGRAVRGQTIEGRDPRRLRLSELEPSGVEPSEVEPSESSYCSSNHCRLSSGVEERRDRVREKKTIVRSVGNLLTQWELRRKTDVENLRFV